MQNVEEQTDRELPQIQRGIVDSCFEEGHYEYGIGVLDRLRGSRYKPFPLHIRQLLYISLYPPPPESSRRNRANAPPLSPTKVQFQRHKDDLWPKPASRPLSIALLNALVSTNTPESLMRGLPHYQYVDLHGAKDVDPFQKEKPTQREDAFEDSSPLKNETLAMQRQKDCWELLREGIVKRKQTDRHRDEDDLDVHENAVVGSYAWPALEWLILVFEKDERRAKERDQAQHSALLLCQIPPPREKRGPRWDVEMPIKVAFACFLLDHTTPVRSSKYESYQKRYDLGARLVLLLVNLTLTRPPLLSPSHLLRSLVQRLPELPVSSLEILLAMIPPSQASFKLALLEHYISQETRSNANNTRPAKTSTARPVPRAKPKLAGKGAVIPDVLLAASSAGSQDKDKDAYSIPTPDKLIELLECPLPIHPVADGTGTKSSPPPQSVFSAAKIAFAKLQMVSVLFMMHISHNLENTSSRWMSAVREGKLRQSVQAGITFRGMETEENMEGDMIRRYLSQALDHVKLWEEFEAKYVP